MRLVHLLPSSRRRTATGDTIVFFASPSHLRLLADHVRELFTKTSD
jgi:hypothetical protein